MLFRVDPLSTEPILEQIAQHVKRSVARGRLSAGDRLPSVRELAKEQSINPNTVIRAYDILEREGVIARRQGSGCFVTGAKSQLRDDERRKRLRRMSDGVATEAFHLGFSGDDVRKAIEGSLREFGLDRSAESEPASEGDGVAPPSQAERTTP